MFIEANCYSEYGNDIPGLFYFLYVIYLFLDLKKFNLSYEEFGKISLFSLLHLQLNFNIYIYHSIYLFR